MIDVRDVADCAAALLDGAQTGRGTGGEWFDLTGPQIASRSFARGPCPSPRATRMHLWHRGNEAIAKKKNSSTAKKKKRSAPLPHFVQMHSKCSISSSVTQLKSTSTCSYRRRRQEAKTHGPRAVARPASCLAVVRVILSAHSV